MLVLLTFWLQITGEDLYRASRFSEAREVLLREAASSEATPMTWFWLGYANLALGDKPAAIEPFERYLEAKPKDEDVLYALARTYAQLAALSLQTIFALEPNSARAHQMRAIRFELEQNWEQAIASYRTALQLDPGLRGVWSSIARIYEREWKDGKQARLAAAREVTSKSANPGIALVEAGKPRESLQELLKWRAGSPRDPSVYYYLGEAYTDLKIATIQRLREANAASYRLHQIVAENYASIHKNNEAIEEYREALKLKPGVPGLQYELARLLADSAPGEARGLLEAELQADPDHYMAKSLLGQLLAAMRESGKAIPLLESALQGKPSLVDARRALGKALLDAGKAAQALEHLRRVAAENPEDEQVHFLLAQAYRALGKPDEAAREMKIHQEVLRSLAGK